MREALVNARIFIDGGFVEGQAVIVDGERIAAIISEGDARGAGARVTDLGGGLLLPGFIDIQVNGGAGALFNEDPSVETIRTIGAAHRRFGTTAFLPTLITDDLPVIRRAIDAVRSAIEQRVPGVIGIHIEGPSLSAERKGTHDAGKFRALDDEGVKLLSSLGNGRTLVTLAPETTTPAMISKLAHSGVVISAGHTNADYRTIATALLHGVTGFTHLFNAMSPLTSRAPGAVGDALDDDECWCGIIVDGHHVDPVTLRIALRAKSRERFILVTDAMPTVGSKQDWFMLQGRRVTLRNGLCVDERGVISGSSLDMASAVRNAVRWLDVDVPTAVRMASENPAAFLRLERDYGRIAAGMRANLVHVDEDIGVKSTWIDGKIMVA